VPRNEIALIVGLIVALGFVFVGPYRAEGVPRSPRALGGVLVAFLVTFAIIWIVLRLIGY
jgi:hypothetical protein